MSNPEESSHGAAAKDGAARRSKRLPRGVLVHAYRDEHDRVFDVGLSVDVAPHRLLAGVAAALERVADELDAAPRRPPAAAEAHEKRSARLRRAVIALRTLE